MTKRRKPVALEPIDGYAPGYFLALVQRHDWPPGFVSRWPRNVPQDHGTNSQESTARREKMARDGTSWGTGTMALSSKPRVSRLPGWIGGDGGGSWSR